MYQVVGWNDNFEVAKTRSFKNKTTCTMPCKHGLGFRLIASNQEGAAIFGAWCAMIQIISRHKAPRAGYLTSDGTDSGRPYTADDLHVLTGIPSKYFSLMFDLCSSESIGWLIVIEPTDTTRIPHGYHEDTMRILCDHLNSNLNSNSNYDSSEAPGLPSKPDEDKNRTEFANEGSMLSAAQREQAKNPPRQRVDSSSEINAIVSEYLNGCTSDRRKSVEEWLSYKRQIKKPYKAPSGMRAFFGMIDSKYPDDEHLSRVVQNSMANGWIGLYDNVSSQNKGKPGSGPIEVA